MDENNPYFYSVSVTISGPGQCIWREMELVKRALESNGIKLKIVDEYPTNATQEELDKRLKEEPGFGVVLVADHQPWGG